MLHVAATMGLGFLGGAFAFACLRLWMSEKVSKVPQDMAVENVVDEMEGVADNVSTNSWLADDGEADELVDDGEVDEEAQKVMQVKIACQIAQMSIDGLDHQDEEMREYEQERFERYKQKALDLVNEIEDEFYHSAAIHSVVSLYLAAGQTDEARNLIEQITVDMIREKALAEFGPEHL